LVQNDVKPSTINILTGCHVLLLIVSNVLVQYPFNVFSFHTTWGAFTYPAIFILTDLTVRIYNVHIARKIIFRSMLPGLLISYGIASYIEEARTLHWNDVITIHLMPFRIAVASFIAYIVGQLLDVFVFQRYRFNSSWWLAPALSNTVGNLVDTVLFFAIAFYQSTNPFLSQHWPEIAAMDIFFKITISLMAFVPIYGFVLNIFRVNFRPREGIQKQHSEDTP